MIPILKNTFLHRNFIKIKTRLNSNDSLKTQLLKEAHLLDKSNQDNAPNSLALFEVEAILKEIIKRKGKPDESIKWAWSVLYSYYFKEKFNKEEKKENYDKNEVEKIIKERRSIRIWTEKKVDVNIIKKAIDIAKWAPSSCNRQPWKFLIVTKRKNKEFLQVFNRQLFYQKAPLIIIALVNIHEYGRNEKHYSYLDIAAVTQNLLLILNSKGLGTCWLGVNQARSYLKKCKKIQAKFKIEKYYLPVSIIAVGYPKIVPLPPGRKKTKDLIILE